VLDYADRSPNRPNINRILAPRLTLLLAGGKKAAVALEGLVKGRHPGLVCYKNRDYRIGEQHQLAKGEQGKLFFRLFFAAVLPEKKRRKPAFF
jgi:hypothetical protein